MTKIPPDKAEFFFNAEPGKMPTEFVVTHRDRRMDEFRSSGFDSSHYLRSSLGCHVAEWLKGSPIQTPAGVFARVFLRRLSVSELDAIRGALTEIGKIEGEDWAQAITDALDEMGHLGWLE